MPPVHGTALAGQGDAAVTAGTDGPQTWEYIALGDSYSAGRLIPLPDVTCCVRSTSSYPKLLNKKLDFASIEDVTCSAAKTTDMRQSQTTRLLPERGTCAKVPFAAGDYRWADRVSAR